MGWRRFFIKEQAAPGDLVQLSQQESTHVTTVLRLSSGQQVELFDGTGFVYAAVLEEMGKTVTARVLERTQADVMNKTPLWLYQALLKGNKIDDLIPACTELGVDVLSPFQSSRCQGKLAGERLLKKTSRWQRITESSCKQCGRPVAMKISPTDGFGQLIESTGPPQQGELRIFFWEEERTQTLSDIDFTKKYDLVRIILGPEGGFSPEEAKHAIEMGWRPTSMGDMVLRAETATITAVSVVQHLTGNLG